MDGLALAFAIVDAAGRPVVLARMDEANWVTPQVALGVVPDYVVRLR